MGRVGGCVFYERVDGEVFDRRIGSFFSFSLRGARCGGVGISRDGSRECRWFVVVASCVSLTGWYVNKDGFFDRRDREEGCKKAKKPSFRFFVQSYFLGREVGSYRGLP